MSEIFKDFMLDLETMGTRPGCAVVSIGLVGFDYEADRVGEPFYAVLNMHAQLRGGLHMDGDTLEWWTQQEAGAQRALIKSARYERPLNECLLRMLTFLEDHSTDAESYRIWANGANFDQPILREVLRVAGLKAPWPFWNEKCHRTLKDMPTLIGGKRPDLPANKAAHRADADAVFQARQAVACLRHMAAMPLSRYAEQPPAELVPA
ncbi:3'-5' exonuclease [Cupriavidus necator]